MGEVRTSAYYWSLKERPVLVSICEGKEREKSEKKTKKGIEMGRAPCCDKANVKKGPWSPEEDSKLKHYIETYGTGGNWISLPQKAGMLPSFFSFLSSRFKYLTFQRLLINWVMSKLISSNLNLFETGLKRCGKSCRLRWLNYLRPNIKHGEFSAEEDRIICTLFATIGSR